MTVRLLWQAWCAVMVVLGLPVVLWGGGGPPDLGDEASRNDAFLIPELRAGLIPPEDQQELAAGTLWGAGDPDANATGGSDGTAGATAPWSLVGVYAKDRMSELVLTFAEEGKTPQRLRPGDTLPDGSVVVTIERDRVGVGASGASVAERWIHVNRQGEPPRAAN